jgi:hypothetical protein
MCAMVPLPSCGGQPTPASQTDHPEFVSRAMVLMAPGWVRTELGGPDARLSIEESVPSLVNVLLSQRSTHGLRYLDYLGRTVPW